jgi:hypothetical protein
LVDLTRREDEEESVMKLNEVKSDRLDNRGTIRDEELDDLL